MNFLNIWKETTLIAVLIGFIVFVIALKIQITNKKNKNDPIRKSNARFVWRALLWSFFTAYLVFIPALTIFPLPSFNGPMPIHVWRNNIVLEVIAPIIRSARTAQEYLGYNDSTPLYLFLYNTIGNLLLLMPFVIFMRILITRRYTIIFVIALGISLLIESSQGLLCYLSGVQYRIVDINDVILNITGASIMILCLGLIDGMSYVLGRLTKK
ncbi:MAG TPA: VanZ family protein [Clostridiaceae bacterium]|nr:VanZ family protein [Clostridiaceae bacterium]